MNVLTKRGFLKNSLFFLYFSNVVLNEKFKTTAHKQSSITSGIRSLEEFLGADLFLKKKVKGTISKRIFPLILTNEGIDIKGMLLNEIPEKFDFISSSGIVFTKRMLLRHGLAIMYFEDAIIKESFTEAAKHNNIQQSGLSLKIKKLEDALKITLFSKKISNSNKRVVPLQITEDGLELIKIIRQIPEEFTFI